VRDRGAQRSALLGDLQVQHDHQAEAGAHGHLLQDHVLVHLHLDRPLLLRQRQIKTAWWTSSAARPWSTASSPNTTKGAPMSPLLLKTYPQPFQFLIKNLWSCAGGFARSPQERLRGPRHESDDHAQRVRTWTDTEIVFFKTTGPQYGQVYAKATSCDARPACMVERMTRDAGPLNCKPGSRC
jgi:hypothetical protein